ncbi:GFA family protein [Mesorhizobium sp. ORM8.1]
MFDLLNVGQTPRLVTRFPPATTSWVKRSSRMVTADNSTGAASIERTGGCLCGKIRYRVTSDPRVHYCHCDMCRRTTGSAFAVLAWLPSAEVSWLSEQPYFRRSSPLAKRGFCQACGSPLTLAYDAAIDEIALHVGTFDNPAELEPQYNYGSSQRLSWICCGIDLPHRDTEERW